MSISITTAYKTTVNLPYGTLKNVMEWCEKNCIADWKFDPVETSDFSKSLSFANQYKFYFESERDYVAFIMWKK